MIIPPKSEWKLNNCNFNCFRASTSAAQLNQFTKLNLKCALARELPPKFNVRSFSLSLDTKRFRSGTFKVADSERESFAKVEEADGIDGKWQNFNFTWETSTMSLRGHKSRHVISLQHLAELFSSSHPSSCMAHSSLIPFDLCNLTTLKFHTRFGKRRRKLQFAFSESLRVFPSQKF